MTERSLQVTYRKGRPFAAYLHRRMQIFLARKGHVMSADRAHRLWRVAGLQVPRRRPRRRVATRRPRPLPAAEPNQVWAYDFVFDACANEQVLTCLTVVDEYTREALAIDVAGRIRSARVIGAGPPDQHSRRPADPAIR